MFRPCGRRESFVSAASTRNPFTFANMERAAPGSPIWPCTRWGLPCLVACASSGGLLHHLFTLTGILANPGGIFSVVLSVGTPRGVASRVYPRNAGVQRLRGIVPCGVRTFLPRLAPEAILRLSKTVHIISRNLRGATMESSKSQIPRPKEIPSFKRQEERTIAESLISDFSLELGT